jgi:hypothetical protein
MLPVCCSLTNYTHLCAELLGTYKPQPPGALRPVQGLLDLLNIVHRWNKKYIKMTAKSSTKRSSFKEL